MNKMRYKNLNSKMIYNLKKENKLQQKTYKNYQYTLMIEPKTYNNRK